MRDDHELMAQAASGRVAMYALLLDVFTRVPDRALLLEIEEGRFDELSLACRELGAREVCDGAHLAASYGSCLTTKGAKKTLHELAVDWTRLVRATGDMSLRPPYERLYATGLDEGGSLLVRVQSFYRGAGLFLEEDAREPADFLFVELDFVKQLCSRETEAWSRGADGRPLQELELRFLREHPARWAHTYCVEAEEHVHTDFYRGFLAILDGFMESEMTYLEEETFRQDKVIGG